MRRNCNHVLKGHSTHPTSFSAIAGHPSSSPSTLKNLRGLPHAWAQTLPSATSPSQKTSGSCVETLNANCAQKQTFSPFPSSRRNGTKPLVPADLVKGTLVTVTCYTSDITLAEFKTLCGKMDASVPIATNATQYLGGTLHFHTDLYSTCGTLMTYKEYVRLIDSSEIHP